MSALMEKRKEGRPVNRRDAATLENDREIIAKLHLEGRSTEEVTRYLREQMGRDVSPYMVAADWHASRREWAKQRSEDVAVYMAEELQAINRMLIIAWDRYYEASQALDGVSYDERKEVQQDEENDVALGSAIPTRTKMTNSEVIRSREQAFREQSFWWERIELLHMQKQKIMGIGRSGMTLFINNNNLNVAPVKGYVGVSPDDWPEPGNVLPATIDSVEGIYDTDG